MLNIKVPASSANLGPGFDTLCIALNLYNEFEVELSNELKIFNVDDEFNNEDNLFYKSYKFTANKYNINNEITINFKNINVPISRGLGSSSTMIIAGILACNHLNNLKLSDNQVINIATEIEGHPENVAACFLGGLTISTIDKLHGDKNVITKKIDINNNINFTVIIPPYKTNTEEARKILPKEISLPNAVENISHAVLLVDALKNNELDKINIYLKDNIHEPYRKTLIKDYDHIKDICMKNGAKGFTISGSGSTMLAISDIPNLSKKIAIEGDYKMLDLKVDNEGTRVILY